MTEKLEICAICAWRDTCKKKFSVSGRDVRCPDFSKDLSLENKPDKDTDDSDKAGKEEG